MRLKHIKGSEEYIENSQFVIHDYFHYKGNFQSVFSNNNKLLHVEIGVGKGDFLIENAKRNPHINFVGIEKYDSVLIKAVQKIETSNLDNIKFIRMDAIEIDQVFAYEIDLIYLNFSDPWPKKRHSKRRLSSSFYLEKYDKLFSKENRIIMKTDNRKLMEFSLKSFTDFGYKIEDVILDLYQDDIENNVPTEYERKFHSLGYPIYKLEVFKN